MKKHTYGWVKDNPDFRDLPFVPKPQIVGSLPLSVDLRSKFGIVHNQGQIGSCVLNASVVAFDFTRIKEGLPPILPSRLFAYYNTRVMEGSVNSDAGCMIRDAIKSLATTGICPEKIWDYNPNNLFVKPVRECYIESPSHIVKQYQSLNNANITELKSCLADGYTFVLGFSVYDSFESDAVAATGIVPYPSTNEQYLGGHSMVAVGFNDARQVFIVRNSWSINWGDKGHCYMPYQYLTNTSLSDDFWTIRID